MRRGREYVADIGPDGMWTAVLKDRVHHDRVIARGQAESQQQGEAAARAAVAEHQAENADRLMYQRQTKTIAIAIV